tara:strand:- start:4381 stop:5562 length:1182 start_codon:yes stop_codon:yes gene_type:complete
VKLPDTVPGEHLKNRINEEDPIILPISLYQCEECCHVQLNTIPDPLSLFNDSYTFMPGNNPMVVKHFSNTIDYFVDTFKSSISFTFEIGSNDGLFLDLLMKKTRCKTLGIDPAYPTVKVARERGIDTIHDFFIPGSEVSIQGKYGRPDLIVANNVFAHIDDLQGIVRSIHNLLEDDGYFIFEASYLLDIVNKYLIGTIIHEHLSHHSVYSIRPFLCSFGLSLIDILRVDNIQGGAIIGVAKKSDDRNSNDQINMLIEEEIESGITSTEGMHSFNDRLHSKLLNFKNKILELSDKNQIIVYGAARSAPFILQLLEIGDRISCVIDDNPEKIGKYLPIFNIPIYGSDYLRKYSSSHQYFFLIAGWAQTTRILKILRSNYNGKAASIYPSFQVEDL